MEENNKTLRKIQELQERMDSYEDSADESPIELDYSNIGFPLKKRDRDPFKRRKMYPEYLGKAVRRLKKQNLKFTQFDTVQTEKPSIKVGKASKQPNRIQLTFDEMDFINLGADQLEAKANELAKQAAAMLVESKQQESDKNGNDDDNNKK